MQCPSCRHQLKEVAYNGIEIDKCLNCGGLWFDGDELRKTKDKEDELLRWLDIDLFADPKQFTGAYSTMTCPHDNEPLYEIVYDNTDASVDVCRKCRGIWMDMGEYEKIIASLKRHMFREDAKQYLAHLEEQIKQVVTGPEDAISELRDAYIVFRLLENRIVSQWPRIEEIMVALRTALLK